MGSHRLPSIGIVTPSLNQGRFIRETIESVIGQGCPGLEYWIIDGGSTDGTLGVLRGYGDRVNWVSEKDDSQAQAVNKGLKRITSDIFAFLNSDDAYLPGALSLVAGYFQDHPDAMWLTGDHHIADEAGRRIQPYIAGYKRLLRRSPTFARLAVANFIVQPSTFWRRELLEEIGPFDETLRYCFDYDFWMRAIRRYPLHVIGEPLSCFRIHSASKGGSEFSRQFAEEHKVVGRYTSDGTLLALHKVHAGLIVLAYRLMKGGKGR